MTSDRVRLRIDNQVGASYERPLAQFTANVAEHGGILLHYGSEARCERPSSAL
jgi:hypothetical protein